MRSECTKDLVDIVNKGISGLTQPLKDALEVGIIVPSILRKNLEKAGYVITYHVGPGESADVGKHKHGAWVQIRKDGVLVGRAYSHDEGDALLQAVYGMVKEEPEVAKYRTAKEKKPVAAGATK